MNQKTDFTSGPIVGPLMKFTLPIMGALVLQALYGAVDLLIVGQFASASAVSAVATGSQILHTLTLIITGLAMGITIVVGQQIGEKREHLVGDTIGTGILFFAIASMALTLIMLFAARGFVTLMQAPAEAYEGTVAYVMICSGGIVFITAYNILGSIFRGIGDSKTPFLAVLIACICNIGLDLLFVVPLQMGAAGAALATVAAQAFSVALSLILIRRCGGCGEALRLHHADPLCLHAVHVCLCGPEYRGRTAQTGQGRTAVRNRNLLWLCPDLELCVLFPRLSAGTCLFPGACCHYGCCRLLEGLCH